MTALISTNMPNAHVVNDSVTMLRRSIKHMIRYPSLTLMLIGQPIVFLLLFVYVFGGTMGAGLPGARPGAGRQEYLGFIAPGILIITVASVALSTAISVAMDMTGGIIARFRTMNIARASVLTGHVLAAMIQTTLSLVVVVLVAFLLGYRADAGVGGWLGAIGILALLAFALTWLTVAMGMAAPSVESASNTPMILILLPFISSSFVPTASMPWGLRQFAEYQPFTPVINSVRAFLDDKSVGSDGWLAVGWCVLIAVLGYVWARRRYERLPAR